MKLGYVHAGERSHGVNRYGRMLALELGARPGVELVETDLALTGNARADAAAAQRAGEALSAADVVHVQYNRMIWGEGWRQVRLLRAFIEGSAAPLVASLHDVYPRDPWRAWRKRPKSLGGKIGKWAKDLGRRLPANRALSLLFERSAHVIGHFVEPRADLPERSAARRALGVEARRVVTLLGFIHPRKGYDLAVDALPLVPQDVLLVFAGAPSPGNERALEKWVRRARRSGAGERLLVTGHVSEETLSLWLAATDLAICPFRFFSASGSLATWISTGRPILCHALPQVEEYRKVAKDAFATFAPYTPQALAQAVAAALEGASGAPDPAILALKERFALAAVADQHLALFREVAARGAARHASSGRP
ncbi:MAG: glycosyltransferase [Planctomycetes bacterium]|nr:glycosyltransferase [Planctomycetota bacterium]